MNIGHKIIIKSDDAVPITMWGREGVIKNFDHDDNVIIQLYDNTIYIIEKQYVEDIR